MKYREIKFSQHTIMRMFERSIKKDDIINVIKDDRIIMDYPDDKPFPSKLIIGYIDEMPIHVVLGVNLAEKIAIVITTYVPSDDIWDDEYTRRKK